MPAPSVHHRWRARGKEGRTILLTFGSAYRRATDDPPHADNAELDELPPVRLYPVNTIAAGHKGFIMAYVAAP